MNKYSVTVKYTLVLEREVEVEAANQNEAEETAVDTVSGMPWLKDPVDGFCEGVSDVDSDSFSAGTAELLEGEEPEDEEG
jgi:hypothetical protein